MRIFFMSVCACQLLHRSWDNCLVGCSNMCNLPAVCPFFCKKYNTWSDLCCRCYCKSLFYTFSADAAELQRSCEDPDAHNSTVVTKG